MFIFEKQKSSGKEMEAMRFYSCFRHLLILIMLRLVVLISYCHSICLPAS